MASSDVGISARTAIAESASCQGDLRTCTHHPPPPSKIKFSNLEALFYICHKVFRQKTQLLFHLRKENALIKSFIKKAGTSFCLLLHRSYDCAILNTDIYSIDRGVTDPSKRQGPICHEKKLTSILKLVYQKADILKGKWTNNRWFKTKLSSFISKPKYTRFETIPIALYFSTKK